MLDDSGDVPVSRSSVSIAHRLNSSAARPTAMFIGGFTLLNVLGDWFTSGFDANEWWIDFRPFPRVLAIAVLCPMAGLLVAYALRPAMSDWRRRATLLWLGLASVAVICNIVNFYRLIAVGRIAAGMPVPFSMLVLAALLWLAINLARRRVAQPSMQWWAAAGAFTACVIGFPLAQIVCFGYTDYRQPADVIVVFGARAYADGRPSDALADRVRTAAAMYRQSLAPQLIFSGGPGDGAVHEAEAMRRFAISLGVADSDILMDKQGLSTAATVAGTIPILDDLHAGRVIAVSHFYHLPRIKLAYQRGGRQVYTVPAKETYILRRMPYLIAREVVALWVYYLRPLAPNA